MFSRKVTIQLTKKLVNRWQYSYCHNTSLKKNNNPNNNNQDKKGDKNKKDGNAKSKDKDNNTARTAGAHVREAT